MINLIWILIFFIIATDNMKMTNVNIEKCNLNS